MCVCVSILYSILTFLLLQIQSLFGPQTMKFNSNNGDLITCTMNSALQMKKKIEV